MYSFERGGRADGVNKANGYHTEVTFLRFLKVLYFLLNFLPILAKLSRVFQEEKYLIFEISEHVDIAFVLVQLEQLKRPTSGQNYLALQRLSTSINNSIHSCMIHRYEYAGNLFFFKYLYISFSFTTESLNTEKTN